MLNDLSLEQAELSTIPSIHSKLIFNTQSKECLHSMVLTGRIMYVDEVINMHCGMFINSYYIE